MSRNDKNKMKSLLIAVMMLATAMFVMTSIDNVSASADIGIYTPKAFRITTIAFDGKSYVAQHGLQVYDQVTISWNASWCHLGTPVGYNVTIGNANNNAGSFGAEKRKRSENNGNGTSFLWNTTWWADGDYYINVTAHNSNAAVAGQWWTNASRSYKVTVRNTMRGVPGITDFEGGRYAIGGNKGYRVITNDADSDFKYAPSPNTVNISINRSAGWTVDTKYHLFKPIYGGKSVMQRYYNLSFEMYDVNGLTYWKKGSPDVNTLDNIVLDRAGLWVLASIDGNSNPNLNFKNITHYNVSVDAWFWVNTSQDYTVTPSATTFAYNETSESNFIRLRVYENSDLIDGMFVGDIRRDKNKTSIEGSNTAVASGGTSEPYNTTAGYFWTVGNYTSHAYTDLDYVNSSSGLQYYQENAMANGATGWAHYNETYGANIYKNGSASWVLDNSDNTNMYNWSFCGPYDPPEKNATLTSIRVTTGTPSATVKAANNTVYFGFSGEIVINISEDPSPHYFPDINVTIYNELNEIVTDQFCFIDHQGSNWGESAAEGQGVIDIGNLSKTGGIKINHSSWGKQTYGQDSGVESDVTPFGRNGSWKVVFSRDVNSDMLTDNTNRVWAEEWNTSVRFTVKSSSGRLVFTMHDDDGSVSGGTNTDGVIRRVPAHGGQQPVQINFSVQNSNHKYLGGTANYGSKAAAMKNITISGDALFLEDGPVRLDKFPKNMVSYSTSTHQWTLSLTPKMVLNGGTINIAIEWGSYGSHTETITIGGNALNGSVVDISPSTLTYGTNTTISVTVTSPTDASYGYSNAVVALYWIKDDGDLGDRINATDNPDTTNGNVYSFWFNKTQQSNWQVNATSTNGWGTTIKAPRNITAYVNVPSVGYGYAKAKVEAVDDLKITTYPSTIMAGKGLSSYGQPNSFWINVTKIDSSGNSTGHPSATGLTIRVYNSTGGDITDEIGSFSATELDGSYKNYNFSSEYFREPGTYNIHVYNNTHKSVGSNNQTLIVKAVDVVSSVGDLIWGVDKNISVTFTATFNGETINNSAANDYFRIDNITKQNSGAATQYNKTWTNTSFRWAKQGSGTDQNTGNNSLEVSRYSGGFINGAVTINDLTANELDEKLTGKAWNRPSEQKIHFMYKASTSGSVYANCSGEVLVKIPDVSASPATLPYNKPAELTLTVTGRDGALLNNVRVNITVPGLTAIPGSDTRTDGTVTFAFTPPATGNVRIDIENRTSSLRVPVTSWACYIEADAQVNEGSTFTVTVKNGTAGGTAIVGATVAIRGIGTEATNANGVATFTAPSVTSDRDYTISATFEGHAEDTETMTVINVPVLTIVYPETVDGCSFEVTVADDSGNSIIGATITVTATSETFTFTSGAQGIAKITVKKAGDITLTASKTGFADSETVTITVKNCPPGIPGFELLSLIAALGVAFIIFRRRRR